mgnify:CR=1 FL=1
MREMKTRGIMRAGEARGLPWWLSHHRQPQQRQHRRSCNNNNNRGRPPRASGLSSIISIRGRHRPVSGLIISAIISIRGRHRPTSGLSSICNSRGRRRVSGLSRGRPRVIGLISSSIIISGSIISSSIFGRSHGVIRTGSISISRGHSRANGHRSSSIRGGLIRSMGSRGIIRRHQSRQHRRQQRRQPL